MLTMFGCETVAKGSVMYSPLYVKRKSLSTGEPANSGLRRTQLLRISYRSPSWDLGNGLEKVSQTFSSLLQKRGLKLCCDRMSVCVEVRADQMAYKLRFSEAKTESSPLTGEMF